MQNVYELKLKMLPFIIITNNKLVPSRMVQSNSFDPQDDSAPHHPSMLNSGALRNC